MSHVLFDEGVTNRLVALDIAIAKLNQEKVTVLFEALAIRVSAAELAIMQEWDLILVAVPDRAMAIQLNRYVRYVPHVKFIVDAEAELFRISEGTRGRRVWKER
jgi:hypothetical protein